MHEQEKIGEAEFFYHQMSAEITARKPFKYNLSAFLSAARSVLQYARKEASSKQGGHRWYDTHISSSSILNFFKSKRDVNIHRRPIDPSMAVDIAIEDAVGLSDSIDVFLQKENGDILEQESSQPSMPDKSPSVSVSYQYFFSDWVGPEDVLTLSKMYLSELRSLINDGNTKGFLTS